MADLHVLTAPLLAVLTCAACYPVLRILRRTNRVDVPNGRSSHSTPTPRGGGLAILLALSLFAGFAAARGLDWSSQAWAAVAGAAALALLGLADDLTGLKPHHRLLTQVGVGVFVGVMVGGMAGGVLGGFILPAAVNMVNFMDGINGLCAGHSVVWGVGAMVASTMGGSEVLAVLGAVSLGGGLGFLPWNVPRARLFLGDVGSYLIGGLAGIGVIVALTGMVGETRSGSWPVVGLVCAPYLLFALDTGTTIARRAMRRENLFQAHRDHVYQLLVNAACIPHWAVSLGTALLSTAVTIAFVQGWALGLATAAVAGTVYLASPRLISQEIAA